MGETIISLQQLTKKYETNTAVNRLTLSINKGEIFGLLGPNGAGKSTTILMMLGLTEPTSGHASVLGLNATKEPIEVKRHVGYLPDEVGFYDDMTGLENLMLTAQLNSMSLKKAKEEALNLLKRVGLEQAGENNVGTYSRGMRQRLGLADVLIKRPEVIILDEPTLGIDPEGVREFLNLIKSLSRDEGLTVLLSSHHLHQVQQICDRVGLFVKGRLLAVGQIEELAKALFEKDPIVYHLKCAKMDDEFEKIVRQLPFVEKVNQRDLEQVAIHCSKDDTEGELSYHLIQNGYRILGLSKKNYGLDEIYHRYFEGGDTSEANTQKAPVQAAE